MAQTIKLKRSNTAGNLPTTSNLALGEVGININICSTGCKYFWHANL